MKTIPSYSKMYYFGMILLKNVASMAWSERITLRPLMNTTSSNHHHIAMTHDDLIVRVATWNVAMRSPPLHHPPHTTSSQHCINLKPWLSPTPQPQQTALDTPDHRHRTPDLVVIGFQELAHQVMSGVTIPHVQYSQWIPDPLPHDTTPDKHDQKDTSQQYRRVGAPVIPFLEPWIHIAQSSLSSSSSSSHDTEQVINLDHDEVDHCACQYQPVFACRFVAIGCIVFVRIGCKMCCMDTNTDTSVGGNAAPRAVVSRIGYGVMGTGLLGIYGNKGCIGISIDMTSRPTSSSLDMDTVSMCFMCCHLCAHEGIQYCHHRTIELDHIFNTLVIHDTPYSCGSVSSGRVKRGVRGPGDHDGVWVFGDLNYRLRHPETVIPSQIPSTPHALVSIPSPNPKRSRILELVRDADIHEIVSWMDEVTWLRRYTVGCIGAMHEHGIQFMPTYKYVMSKRSVKCETSTPCQPVTVMRCESGSMYTGNNDTSNKAIGYIKTFSGSRNPAYCDRVLFSGWCIESRMNRYTNTQDKGTGDPYYNWYWSEHGYSMSDHVPVCGDYRVWMRKQKGMGDEDKGICGGRARRIPVYTWGLYLWLVGMRVERFMTHGGQYLVMGVVLIIAMMWW